MFVIVETLFNLLEKKQRKENTQTQFTTRLGDLEWTASDVCLCYDGFCVDVSCMALFISRFSFSDTVNHPRFVPVCKSSDSWHVKLQHHVQGNWRAQSFQLIGAANVKHSLSDQSQDPRPCACGLSFAPKHQSARIYTYQWLFSDIQERSCL